MKLRLVLLFFFAIQKCIAQQNNFLPQVSPPSPEAKAFARYGDIPVGNSTGVPRIEVPIATIQSGKLQLPVSFSYHASGIKVRDISTAVGLGWVLNAGGVISRNIRSATDDPPFNDPGLKSSADFDAAISSATTYSAKYEIISQFRNLLNGNTDGKSDRFNYNFSGHAGIFLRDYLADTLATVPYDVIRIVKNMAGSEIDNFEITDEHGTRYLFSAKETSVSSTGGVPSGTTSWLLTKIISADNVDEITLHYSSSGYSYSNQHVQTMHYGEAPDQLVNVGPGASDNVWSVAPVVEFNQRQITTTYSTKKLDSICAKNATVSFVYAADRIDGPLNRLTSLSVRNNMNGELIQEVSLKQSYFGAGESSARLKLDTIAIKANNDSTVENYKFSYLMETMPVPRYNKIGTTYTNFYEDYWGYYNGETNSSMIPEEFLNFPDPFFNYTWYNTHYNISAKVGNLNPQSSLMQVYMLDSIVYPTGGISTFEFEPNVADNLFYDYTNTNYGVVGGLRIKKITSNPKGGASTVKSYKYSINGNYYGSGIRSWSYRQEQQYNYYGKGEAQYMGSYYHVNQHIETFAHQVYSSAPEIPTTVMDASPIFYAKVTEYNGDTSQNTGKTEFTYEYANPPLYDGLTDYLYLDTYRDAGTPSTNLTDVTFYRSTGGSYIPLKKTINSYDYLKSLSFTTGIHIRPGMAFVNKANIPEDDDPLDQSEFISWHAYEDVKAYQQRSMLVKTETFDFAPDTSKYLKSKTEFVYDTVNLQARSSSIVDSKGDSIQTVYRYTHNFLGTAPYTTMANTRHVLSPVIERIDSNITQNKEITRIKTNYQFWHSDSLILPMTIEKSIGGNTLATEIIFDNYDTSANIIQYTARDGVIHSYIWDYKFNYPTAECINADSASIAYTSFEADGKGGWTYSGSINNTYALTGNKSYQMSGGNITKSGIANTTYIVSYWGRSGSVSVNSTGPTRTGKTIGAWAYYEHEVTTTSLTVSGSIYIDELRLYPKTAQMTSYTYAPLVGTTSQNDPSGHITYYEYDSFNRLKLIRDEDGRILKRMDYKYQANFQQ